MTDEKQSDAEQVSDEGKSAAEGTRHEDDALSSREALTRGFGLLWRAARTVADEIKREVDTSGVKDSLKQAGRELELAAQEASKALEDFIESGPRSPKPDYSGKWPPEGSSEPKRADAGIPEDGGTDEEGRRRDMRILVDDDDE